METAIPEEIASETASPPEDLSDWYRRPPWWPMWVAPWAVAPALATAVPLSRVVRWKGAPTPPMLVWTTFLAIVGLGLYALFLAMVPSRRFPRLVKGLAILSAVIGFGGISWYYALVIQLAIEDPAPRFFELMDPLIVAGIGPLVCMGWGLVLLLVAFVARLAGRRADVREATEEHTRSLP